MPILGREAGTQVYRDLDEHPDDETDPGVAVIRIDGGLFFATAAALGRARPRDPRAASPGCTRVVLDLEGVNFVDSQGAAKLSELHELTDANGVELRLARLKPDVSDVLAADGLIDRIGRDRIHGNVHRRGRGGPRDERPQGCERRTATGGLIIRPRECSKALPVEPHDPSHLIDVAGVIEERPSSKFPSRRRTPFRPKAQPHRLFSM